MTQTIENRAYGVDVSSFNNANVTEYTNAGAKFVLVKVSEGLDYRNPKAQSQISTAKANGMLPMAYHYGRFSSNSNVAVQEGNFAVQVAKNVGIPLGSLFAADWETDKNNITSGNKADNTNAILAFMDVVAKAGYKPFLYSGKALLENNIDTKRITDKYGDCLWVAYYKVEGRQDTADFNWFPTMDHVAIWQFADNWKGLDVDGNIAVKKLTFNTEEPKATIEPIKTSTQTKTWTDIRGMTWHEEHGTFITGGAINLRWGANTQSTLIATLPAGSEVKYNAWARDNAGRVWLQQPRENGHDGYLVGRVGTEAWGTFK